MSNYYQFVELFQNTSSSDYKDIQILIFGSPPHHHNLWNLLWTFFTFKETDGATPGWLLPNPKSALSSWSCCRCGDSRTLQEILDLVSGIEKELRNVCSNKASPENLELFQEFISKVHLKSKVWYSLCCEPVVSLLYLYFLAKGYFHPFPRFSPVPPYRGCILCSNNIVDLYITFLIQNKPHISKHFLISFKSQV